MVWSAHYLEDLAKKVRTRDGVADAWTMFGGSVLYVQMDDGRLFLATMGGMVQQVTMVGAFDRGRDLDLSASNLLVLIETGNEDDGKEEP